MARHLRHDALRPQRLAAPVKVYVEQFSAHPLESDVAELYGPPDGYIGADGVFREHRQNASDKPVYEIELKPDDGLYPLPYMATQARVDHFCELRARARRSRARRRPIFFLRIRLVAASTASYGVDVAAGGLHRQGDGPR